MRGRDEELTSGIDEESYNSQADNRLTSTPFADLASAEASLITPTAAPSTNQEVPDAWELQFGSVIYQLAYGEFKNVSDYDAVYLTESGYKITINGKEFCLSYKHTNLSAPHIRVHPETGYEYEGGIKVEDYRTIRNNINPLVKCYNLSTSANNNPIASGPTLNPADNIPVGSLVDPQLPIWNHAYQYPIASILMTQSHFVPAEALELINYANHDIVHRMLTSPFLFDRFRQITNQTNSIPEAWQLIYQQDGSDLDPKDYKKVYKYSNNGFCFIKIDGESHRLVYKYSPNENQRIYVDPITGYKSDLSNAVLDKTYRKSYNNKNPFISPDSTFETKSAYTSQAFFPLSALDKSNGGSEKEPDITAPETPSKSNKRKRAAD